jgi:endonuclease/exonuclease/phosphatase family metal-dependent hydrolase
VSPYRSPCQILPFSLSTFPVLKTHSLFRAVQFVLPFLCLICGRCAGAENFRIATYNVESYLDEATAGRRVKSAEAKAKVRASILALKPDVLALEEMGSIHALQELQAALKTAGLNLPFSEHVSGHDPDIHLALLSRFPITATRPHTNETYLLSGRRYWVSRGFAETDIEVNKSYSFTLMAAHLKSKRAVGEGDEAEMRLEEAKILRQHIDARLAANPNLNLVVLGDLNDTKDSPAVKAILGIRSHKLVDTRPAERNGDIPLSTNSSHVPRNVTWTHHFEREDTYSRIDYILLSRGMAREWLPEQTYVLTMPNWGVGSDHRPIVATFEANNK